MIRILLVVVVLYLGFASVLDYFRVPDKCDVLQGADQTTALGDRAKRLLNNEYLVFRREHYPPEQLWEICEKADGSVSVTSTTPYGPRVWCDLTIIEEQEEIVCDIAK